MAAKEKKVVYHSLKDYLPEDIAIVFLELPHDQQVQYIREYLSFLETQPIPPASEKKQSVAMATWHIDTPSKDKFLETKDKQELLCTLQIPAQSGFGAQGTPEGMLVQKYWSLQVADYVGRIQHEYVVEKKKNKIKAKTPQLNSRSFYFYWCHAEKQKLMHLLDHIHRSNLPKEACWNHIVIHVDRGMCPDCIAFFQNAAKYEQVRICVADTQVIRHFQSDGSVLQHEAPTTPATT